MLLAVQPSYPIALLAGLLSFLSPCVFPLVPVYAAYLGGRAGQPADTSGSAAGHPASRPRVPVLANGLAFVLGFSAVFVALYYVLRLFEVTLLLHHQHAVDVVAGVIVIVLALQIMGVIRVGWLLRDRRLQRAPTGVGLLPALVLGISFAAGWSPCIGPQLGAILQVAQNHSVGGLPFLLVYCAGLAIPFLVVAVLADRLQGAIRLVNRRLGLINLVAGCLLLGFGLLLVTDRVTTLAQYGSGSPFDL